MTHLRRPGSFVCVLAVLLAALVPGAALVLAALVPTVWTCTLILTVLLIRPHVAAFPHSDPLLSRANGLRAPPALV